MMTPKEKAIEIISKFEQLKPVKMSDYSKIYFPTAKLCALIAVDEILNLLPLANRDYWQEVKSEIELL